MPQNTPFHDYNSQHSSEPEIASQTFNSTCIDPQLLHQDSRTIRPCGKIATGLDRHNKPPALPLQLQQGRALGGPHCSDYDDPKMYSTPPLPYFTGKSRQPTAMTTAQNAMHGTSVLKSNGLIQLATAYTDLHAAQEAATLTTVKAVQEISTPTVRKTGSSQRPRRNSGGGNHSNWRIVNPDDKRVAPYIQQWGHNRVQSIRAHNRPGCTCRLNIGPNKRFDRGVVCGIRSAPINRNQLPNVVAQSQHVRSARLPPKGSQEFFCANCGQGMTQWQSIKTHFPFCVLKFGNPNGHSWYDHPSMCITSRQRYPGQK